MATKLCSTRRGEFSGIQTALLALDCGVRLRVAIGLDLLGNRKLLGRVTVNGDALGVLRVRIDVVAVVSHAKYLEREMGVAELLPQCLIIPLSQREMKNGIWEILKCRKSPHLDKNLLARVDQFLRRESSTAVSALAPSRDTTDLNAVDLVSVLPRVNHRVMAAATLRAS